MKVALGIGTLIQVEGLARQNDGQQGDLAAFGGDVRKERHGYVVLSVADILYGLRRTVCLGWWRYLGRVTLPICKTIDMEERHYHAFAL